MAGEFLGYEFDMPFAPAAGAINGHSLKLIGGQTVDALRSSAAAVWVGTTPPRYNQGNTGKAYHHDKKTGRTLNAMMFPSEGLPAVLEIVPELTLIAEDHGKPIVWNIGTLPGDDPIEILPVMAEQLFETGAQGVEVNLSCPSFGKHIIGYDMDMVYAIREGLRARLGTDQNLLEKWPVFINGKEILGREIAKNTEGIVGATVSNSIPISGRPEGEDGPLLDAEAGSGGRSGRETWGLAHYCLMAAASQVPEGFALISANGVDRGEEVHLRTSGSSRLGGYEALLTAGVTVLIEGQAQGRSYGKTISTIAEEYSEAVDQAA